MTQRTGSATLLAVLLLSSAVVVPLWADTAAAPPPALARWVGHGGGHDPGDGPGQGPAGGGARHPHRWDYGDAPLRYRTTRAQNGPRHRITVVGALTIGTTVTAERDGRPHDGDVDDGLTRPVRLPADAPQVTVRVRNTSGFGALLVGWLDTVGDGFDATERATVRVPVGARYVTLRWRLPSGTPTGAGYLRLRLYQGRPSHPAPTGAVHGGEVEDYRIALVSSPPRPTPTPQPPPTAAPPTATPRPTAPGSTTRATPTRSARPAAPGPAAPRPASTTRAPEPTATSPRPPLSPSAPGQPSHPAPVGARTVTHGGSAPAPGGLPLTWSIALLIVAPAAAGAAHAVGRAARRRQ